MIYIGPKTAVYRSDYYKIIYTKYYYLLLISVQRNFEFNNSKGLTKRFNLL